MWHWLFIGPWIFFGAWWLVRALGTARTASQESMASRLSHALFLGGGALLMIIHPRGFLAQRLWPQSFGLACTGLVLDVAGVAFAIWAREHLGRLWSGTITLKEGHLVVRSGPYRWARHPIYTGILTGLTGVVIARADLSSLVALTLVAIGVVRKVVIEERLLVEHFGDEYESYRREVKTIVPFLI